MTIGVPVTSGLVAEYQLNEGTGTTVHDTSGNAFDATGASGSFTWNAQGVSIGSGGIGLVSSTMTSMLAGKTGYTIQIVFKTDPTAVANDDSSYLYYSSSSHQAQARTSGTKEIFAPSIQTSSGSTSTGGWDTGFSGMAANSWYLGEAVWDGTNFHGYTNNDTGSTKTASGTFSGSSSNGFYMGAVNNTGNDGGTWSGTIAYVVIYNRGLTATERQQNQQYLQQVMYGRGGVSLMGYSGGGTTPSGSISASGTSSTTVSGYPVPTGKIAASGTSSASVSGTAVIESSISASGTGSVSITGTNVIVGSISASGTSSASVAGTSIVEGSITASGTSSVSITGSAVSGDGISAQGTSTVTVNGFSVPIGQVSAQGTSNVGVSGHTIVMGSISAQGTSGASVSGTPVSNASITTQGSSSVSISGVSIVTASITAQGVSSVTIESSGAVFGSITAGGTSVIDIEGHTIIVGQINAQGTATVVVSTAKPIRAIINLVSSLDNKPSLTSSLDNRINLQSGVTPLAAVNQNFNLWQYSNDQITFTHSGDLSGSTLEWIMQPNVLSATPTIKKTSADGSINITSTSANQSVYIVTITNTDMASVLKGNYFHQATVVDGQQESNPICQGTVTVLGASNN